MPVEAHIGVLSQLHVYNTDVAMFAVAFWVRTYVWHTGRAGADMALCNGSLYLVAGYSANKSHPCDVWSLPQHAITAKPVSMRKASAIPEEVTPQHQPDR